MLRSHLRAALRRLRRYLGYTVLNVGGLAVALAVCGVLLVFLRHEAGYETFHEHADRLYLLVAQGDWAGQPTTRTSHPAALGPALEEGLPEVERAVRVERTPALQLRDGDGWREVRHLYYADAGVFEAFTLPLVVGDARTALAEPATAVVEEPLVRELFGELPAAEAVGRTLDLGGQAFRITGVMARVPATTHWRPRALLSLAGRDDGGGAGLQAPFLTYLLLARGADPEAAARTAASALGPVVAGTALAGETYHLQPVRSIHFTGLGDVRSRTHLAAATLTTPSVARLRVFGLVAVLIVVLAGVNYVNLATAQGLARAREVGVRKTMGARRRQLAAQFLAESAVVALAAGLVALVLVALAMGPFAEAVQVEYELRPRTWAALGVGFLGMALAVGLAAGAYPALVLSRAEPSAAFRGGLPAGRGGSALRHGLVVFQFAVSAALIVCTLVMMRQVAFMQAEPLGLDPERVLVVDLPFGTSVGGSQALRAALEADASVEATAAGLLYPGRRTRAEAPVAYRRGAPAQTTQSFIVEPEVLRLLRLEVVAGEGLPERPPSDGIPPAVLNETAVAAAGWTPEQALGQVVFRMGHTPYRVVGVVRDFHSTSLREPIQPGMFELATEQQRLSVLARYAPGQAATALTAARAAWEGVVPEAPLRAHFLDDTYDALYSAERRLAGLFGAFGLVAVFVACLGLLGLAAFAAERRRQEVGIRKVLGASEAAIVLLLSREFARLVLVALVFAVPLSYGLMSRWLEGFAHRVQIGVGVFLVAGIATLALALLTVGYHAWRAASADPVKSLRSE